MTSEAAALTEQIAEVLYEHLPRIEKTGYIHGCKCGWSARPDKPHRTHVAAEIAARLADSRPAVTEAAEWNGDKRAGGWLGKHDPAEMNTLARIVTDNAGERHPLFSVRYGIAVALLESDWLAERDKANWNEGHAMCCDNPECAGAYEGTPHAPAEVEHLRGMNFNEVVGYSRPGVPTGVFVGTFEEGELKSPAQTAEEIIKEAEKRKRKGRW